MIHGQYVAVLVCTTASESGVAIAVCCIAREDRRIVVNKSFAILDFDVFFKVVIPPHTKHTTGKLCRIIVSYELNALTAEQRHNGIVKHMCAGVNVNGIGECTAFHPAYRCVFGGAEYGLLDENAAAGSDPAVVLRDCTDDRTTG